MTEPAPGLAPASVIRILRFAVPYRRALALFLLLILADAAIGIANPLLYGAIINDGVAARRVDIVVLLAALSGALSLASAGLGLWQSYVSARIGGDVLLSLRTKLFAHIQAMPLAFFARTRTGALLSRLNGDVAGAYGAFTDVLSNLVGNAVNVVLVLIAMFALSWPVAAVSLALMPLILLPNRLFGRKLEALTRKSYDLTAAMNDVLAERFNLSGAQTAKIFGRPDREAALFAAAAAGVSDVGVRRAVYGRLFFTMLMLIWALATALAYGLGGMLAIGGALSVGTLVALVAYLWRLCSSFMNLSGVPSSLAAARVSFARVFEILDLAPAAADTPGAVDLPDGPARIVFAHVDFRYPAARDVAPPSLAGGADDDGPAALALHDVCFAIEPGQRVALVGPSGAGKTTITQLVARFYDPAAGRVLIDGVDLREVRRAALWRRIGIVTQEPFLFHDTIRENLLYARPDAGDAELAQALAAAQLAPLVESLPHGLDTLVGERGLRFSGGERQRFAIARLLLKAPDIVILDEATAHLDSDSEAAIQAALKSALAGRTSLVIAHRLSTVVDADAILVIDRGRVVERGRHAALLAEDGLYAELCRKQLLDDAAGGLAA